MQQTVVITGASKGIGKATALLFYKKGYNVVINYNKSKDEAEKLQEFINSNGGASIAVKADVSKMEGAQRLIDGAIKRFGQVDILVNNCGVSMYKMFIDMTVDEMKFLMDTDFMSAAYCSQCVIKDMLKRKEGTIVNVSSSWGLTGASMEAMYSAAKWAIIGLTKSLANEYAYSGIRVNAVAPGVTQTEMFDTFCETDKKLIIENVPLNRAATPEEIAEGIYFIATHKYTTGIVLNLTGGSVI
ncbi:MAG: SDR family NAD(P)-dependent oxidoreductase [Clostridia bacterium]